MRALVLAILLLLVAAPAQASTIQAAPVQEAIVQAATAQAATLQMDYWQYMDTFPTEERCHEEGAKIPDGVDYYACWPDGGAWEFYWVFLT